jgi:hypothetical protein
MAASKSNPQSGLIPSDPSTAPFATRSGTPTNAGGSPSLTAGAVSPPPNVDQGDSSSDIDQAEVPATGRVLQADPPSDNSGGGGLGNGGGLPFKNLR